MKFKITKLDQILAILFVTWNLFLSCGITFWASFIISGFFIIPQESQIPVEITPTIQPTAIPTQIPVATTQLMPTPTQWYPPDPTITAQPTETPIPIETPTEISPTDIPTEVPPTAAPIVQPSCECGYNAYNCSGAKTVPEGCFEYCISIGAGDIHDLDRDNDGDACE